MKKSSLKSFIREEIISILKEASTALVTSKGGTKPVSFSNPAELNQLKADTNVTSITTTAGQKIKETESEKEIKVGDKVIPKVGPHKGIEHKVIHIFDDGTFNIQPVLKHGQKNMYRLGAVKTSLKDVELVSEAKTESDYFEREPKAKDIEKGEGIIAKTKKLIKYQQELKQLTKDMQELAAEYKEAEGSDKGDILSTLKVKTAAKKELEKRIEQLEKYV